LQLRPGARRRSSCTASSRTRWSAPCAALLLSNRRQDLHLSSNAPAPGRALLPPPTTRGRTRQLANRVRLRDSGLYVASRPSTCIMSVRVASCSPSPCSMRVCLCLVCFAHASRTSLRQALPREARCSRSVQQGPRCQLACSFNSRSSLLFSRCVASMPGPFLLLNVQVVSSITAASGIKIPNFLLGQIWRLVGPQPIRTPLPVACARRLLSGAFGLRSGPVSDLPFFLFSNKIPASVQILQNSYLTNHNSK
jgi:hypothetical protein